ncbi:MAG TPA: neutral zinc metallopeptidase, partial [Jatrophihabitans sp.]|nr:neutral zinc metallopeptidase [Jatrophihabitans sp.]
MVLLQVLGGGGSAGLPGGVSGLSDVGTGNAVSSVDNAQLAASCKTGKDANRSFDCAIVADIESIEDYWQAELPSLGTNYVHAPTRFFRGQTSTGCGAADSGVGPFYCPADRRVYIDLSFFDELKTQ